MNGATILRRGRVIDPANGIDDVLDVKIVDGRIAAVEACIDAGPDDDIIDCAGRLVTPAWIDMHVHLRDPGFPEKETLETGGRHEALVHQYEYAQWLHSANCSRSRRRMSMRIRSNTPSTARFASRCDVSNTKFNSRHR